MYIPLCHADSIFGAIVSGIRDADFFKQKRLLKLTYKKLSKIYEHGTELPLINKIWHFEKLDSECWNIIEAAISFAEIDRSIWMAINECIRKTKRDNINLRNVVSIICNSEVELIDIGAFHFETLLIGLARINASSSVTELSKLAVFQNFYPNKYSIYVENPEKVIDDYKDRIIVND